MKKIESIIQKRDQSEDNSSPRYFIYIIECNDGTLYTGWTIDLGKRLAKHNQGKGAKYTRSRYPVVLKYAEQAETKSEACKREYRIKQLSRVDKLRLINENPYYLSSCLT